MDVEHSTRKGSDVFKVCRVAQGPIIKPHTDVYDSIAVCRLHASHFASLHSEQPTIQVLNSNKSP